MEKLSKIVRDSQGCKNCEMLECGQAYSYCPEVGKDVDWYINNNRIPLQCPKRRKET